MIDNIVKFKKMNFCVTMILSVYTIFYANPVSSTIMVKKYDTGEMIARSDTIVFGKVKDISYEENTQNQIFTYTTIECENIFKGNKSLTEFKVIEIGGKTEKYTTAVYGAPSYKINEDVLLFLRTNKYDKRLKKVVGLNQGKYSIINDTQTGEKIAVSDLSDINFVDKNDQNTQRKIHKIKFADLIKQIRSGVEEENNAKAIQNQDSESARHTTGKPAEKFDLVKWIREQIIRYCNKAAVNYNNTARNFKYKGNRSNEKI